ncbi:uncharacterized protein F4812DRAFT_470283 [Daldinia caldariorum]|uniref:uncharacterized protein n=1 Tax=Daldinia caldariorum TaxID=326644 RepID=UPI00200866F3|nr:uncharacterized protein F4812DRAFT_470283 [Daldinia caldariorum]KAI1469239.1 hypothetical protein F4812DRAFT_470283 [Daldinia caldariorum]
MYHSQAGYTRQLDSQYRNFAFPMPTVPQNLAPAPFPQFETHRRITSGGNIPLQPSPREETPSVTQPQMEQMMTATTGSYQGLIQNFVHFRHVHDQYLKMHNRPKGNCSDFPSSPQEQQQLVKVLFEAAHDCSQTYEPEGSQSVRRIRSGSYSDIEFELVLWPVLLSTRDAQAGQCRLPNYLYCKEPPYNSYGSFVERFAAVCDALRSSKDVVVSLFKDATFKHRLAWRPRTELNQKATNRKLNGERDVQNAIGIRVAQENGIKTTHNGELVDRNGQSYGTVKKRSAAFEDKISKARKRGRDLKRLKGSDDASTQNGQKVMDNHDDSSMINGGEDTGNMLPPGPNLAGNGEDMFQEFQEAAMAYAPNAPNNTNAFLMQPSPNPKANVYGQDPNSYVASGVAFPISLQEGNNASPDYAHRQWLRNTVPTAGYPDSSTGLDFNLDLPKIENQYGAQYGQLQGATNFSQFNPAASVPFDSQLNQTMGQEQSESPNFAPYTGPQLQNQYFFPGPSGYGGSC